MRCGENASTTAGGTSRMSPDSTTRSGWRWRIVVSAVGPGFGPNGEDWFGFVFLADEWIGEPLRENVEGTLDWVPLDQVLAFDLPMWEGDVHFLPLVFDDDPRPFHGVMPYRDGRMQAWNYTR